ncbi:hypothetical protein ABZ192_19285 [Streptomyces sp. NPDC006235]|uniref:hypothetical protein n=1 Tax=Streptomyces sp. NPDC006235 TaxID=3156736 RepID=UPI0033A8D563
MTTHGLLTAWPDARITAAIPMSCVDMGNPSPSVRAKALFIHGDRDGTCPISSARQAYGELPAAKAFAVEPLRRHRGPRPPSRRRHFLHHHLGIPPELRSNHARPGCARLP